MNKLWILLLSVVVFTATFYGYRNLEARGLFEQTPKVGTQIRTSTEPQHQPIDTDEILFLVNDYRATKNLAPLEKTPLLCYSAQLKAKDLVDRDYWAHYLEGEDGLYFIELLGIKYVKAGENLAQGYDDEQELVDAWIASPTHEENMSEPLFTGACVSTAYYLKGHYTVDKKKDGEVVVLHLYKP